MNKNRRLTIRATERGWTADTEYYAAGYWRALGGTAVTTTFPLHLVARVADRDDFIIRVQGPQPCAWAGKGA